MYEDNKARSPPCNKKRENYYIFLKNQTQDYEQNSRSDAFINILNVSTIILREEHEVFRI